MATLSGRDGNDKITGTEQDDTIDGRLGNDILNGLDGSDYIYGKGGEDTLDGGAGLDFLYGGTGRDHLMGGDGGDFLWGFESEGDLANPDADVLEGGDGDDYLQAARGELYGGPGDDNMEGIKVLGGEVTMYGGAGNDRMEAAEFTGAYGGVGDDRIRTFLLVSYQPTVLDGGSGFDTLLVGQATDGVRQVLDFAKVTNFEELFFIKEVFYDVPIVLTDNVAEADSTFFIRFESNDGGTASFVLDGSSETDAHFDIIAPIVKSITGGQLSDVIRGGGIIDGHGGNDELSGVGDSEDRFIGGTGDDRIDGGDGLDTAIYSGAYANYTLTEVTFNTFTVTDNVGNEGTDTIIDVNQLQFADKTIDIVIGGIEIIGDGSAEVLTGSSFADHIDGAGGADTLSGGGGNDLIDGGDGADKVSGDSGNDFLNGDAGTDQLTGGEGNDVLDGGTDADTLSGGNGSDAIDAGDGDDQLNGGAGADTLTGGSGDDTVTAGDGNDVIVGGHGAGNDTYNGGAGIDTVRYLSARSGIIVDLTATSNQARSLSANDAAGIGIDQLSGIENVIGGNFNDRLAGNSGSNRLTGALGNDILFGFDGNDTLDGGKGADNMRGGAGNDTYFVDSGKDRVIEIAASTATTSIDAGGIDTVRSSISFNLASTTDLRLVENLVLLGTAKLTGRGNALGNAITGNGGNNALFGNAGDDTLAGGAGNDRLSGGTGSDTLRGGAGADRFIFDTAPAASDVDLVLDFSRKQGDKFLFSAGAFDKLGAVGKLSAEAFHAAKGAKAAQDASDRLIYDLDTGTLYYDADGAGGAAAQEIAHLGLTTHPGLSAADFLILA